MPVPASQVCITVSAYYRGYIGQSLAPPKFQVASHTYLPRNASDSSRTMAYDARETHSIEFAACSIPGLAVKHVIVGIPPLLIVIPIRDHS